MHLSKLFLAASAALSLAACASTPGPLGAAPATSSLESALVQRQLDAYNAHDLEGFLATYSPEIEIFDISDAASPQMTGIPAMREAYGGMFASLPDLRCDLGNRIADGAFVIDHEICAMGAPDDPPQRAIAIYQVEDGFIRRVWFASLE